MEQPPAQDAATRIRSRIEQWIPSEQERRAARGLHLELEAGHHGKQLVAVRRSRTSRFWGIRERPA
jgi:hypothetical protein